MLYDKASILAYAEGNPSEAFGEPYKIFDEGRVLARLPRDPYLFMDRVVELEPPPWELKAGGWIECEYDVPPDAWYFRANRQSTMSFAVLLEIALQPCGWLAAYVGSALHSDQDLSFRNLGGEAILHAPVTPDAGTLTMRVRMKEVSKAGGMIIEKFDMLVYQHGQCVYEGDTYFGFFSDSALAEQVGIIDADSRHYLPTEEEKASCTSVVLEDAAPLTPYDPSTDAAPSLCMPAKALRMVDEIELFLPEGGPDKLGFLRGVKHTNPDEWFFHAHFYQDPVWPGSLGLESFLQIMRWYAIQRWPEKQDTHEFEPIATGEPHKWIYRGQILPKPSRVEVDVVIKEVKDGERPYVKADGFLKVNGLYIYEMVDFGLRLVPHSAV